MRLPRAASGEIGGQERWAGISGMIAASGGAGNANHFEHNCRLRVRNHISRDSVLISRHAYFDGKQVQTSTIAGGARRGKQDRYSIFVDGV
jgi:hypothetical protein